MIFGDTTAAAAIIDRLIHHAREDMPRGDRRGASSGRFLRSVSMDCLAASQITSFFEAPLGKELAQRVADLVAQTRPIG